MTPSYERVLDAYVRGSGCPIPEGVSAYEAGRAAGLKVHYFKRTGMLPRVRIVLGFLRGVAFETLLDVGSGRGAFLWPFLEAFPDKEVHVIDMLPRRLAVLRAVAASGVYRLHAHEGDVRELALPDGSIDVVTMLEVLEHIPDAEGAVRNALRIARRHVVVTVPSKPDDNPEHVHLFTRESLGELFCRAGCSKLNFGAVLGHMFMVASR